MEGKEEKTQPDSNEEKPQTEPVAVVQKQSQVALEENDTSRAEEHRVNKKRKQIRFGIYIGSFLVNIILMVGTLLVFREAARQFGPAIDAPSAAKGALILAQNQDRANGRNIEIAQENFRTQERAWISPSGYQQTGSTMDTNFGIRVKIQNFGKTPAINCNATLTFHIQQSDEINQIPHNTRSWPSIGIMAPSDTAIMKERIKNLIPGFDSRYVEAINTEKAWLFMYVFITYDDLFGKTDTTSECNIFDPKRGFFVIYKRLNLMK